MLSEPSLSLLRAAALVLLLSLAGLAAHGLALRALRRAARTSGNAFWTMSLGLAQGPARLAVVLLALELARAFQPLPEAAQDLVQKGIALCWIGLFAWLALALGGVLARYFQTRHDIRAADNLEARRVLTQLAMARRIYTALVMVLTLAAALMVFDATRNIGTSVLASAGIAGAVAGLSAQKFLATVLAGAQIAFTQPIRLDDVVVVEGEWGRVEEITLTYVVVRIWDERRLMVPVTYFLDKPVQNWTRASAEILGSVFLHVDYRAPVPAVREELSRLCREEGGELWDGRVCGLQVVEAGAATLTLRALVSSANSSRNWDLRCLVRERLVDFLRRHHPESLPRTRVALAQDVPGPPEETADE